MKSTRSAVLRAAAEPERHRPAPRRARQCAFAVVPAIVLVAFAELVVRWTGAGDTCTSPAIARVKIWECDPILHFRMRSDLRPDGKPLNSLRFRDDEFAAKPARPFRVLALGDSVTFGHITSKNGIGLSPVEPYADILERLAATDTPAVDVLNAGTSGYSSYHGVMLLRTKLSRVDADLITVEYGWNDLLAAGLVVGALREPATALGRSVEGLLLHTALYGFAKRLGTAMHARMSDNAPPPPIIADHWTPTIPLEGYRENLRRIVTLARARGARIWFLTTPDAFMTAEYRGGVGHDVTETARAQLFQVQLGGIRSFEELARIHAAYNYAMQAVARELAVQVVDLTAVFRAHAEEHLFENNDVIHPNQRGHELIAEAMYARLLDEGLVTRTDPVDQSAHDAAPR